MDYFTLIPDKVCPLVRICNHTDSKILQAVMRGEAHQIPDGTVFRLKEVPDSGMPDIIFQPVFFGVPIILSVHPDLPPIYHSCADPSGWPPERFSILYPRTSICG